VAGEIVRIDGHEATRGDGLCSFVVTFSDGSQDHRQLLEVSMLATTAGLHLAHTEDTGSFRWAKD